MALILRTFRSWSGRDSELVESLRQAAWDMLRSEPGSVLICRSHDPREIVWLGDRGTDSELSQLPRARDLAGSDKENPLEPCGPTLSLRFVDEWYRFPAPPHQVWNFAGRVGAAGQREPLKELFAWSPRERQPHVVGRSLYRAIEDPSLFIGFVGLSLGWLRQNAVAGLTGAEHAERTVIWRPLSMVHRIERAPGGVPRTTDGREASAASFWPRSVAFRAPSMAGANSDVTSVAVACADPRAASVRPPRAAPAGSRLSSPRGPDR